MADGERQRRFEALLREHQRIVFKIAAVYARNPHDREDLAQDIAAQLWRSFKSFDAARAKFSTWMYRVALNVAISHVRDVRRSGAEFVQPLDDAQLHGVADGGAPHDEAMQREQRSAGLHAFISGLDPLNRALVLLYLEDRSYAEIADVLGISETNVATKLNRIKNKLRGQMAAAATEGANHGHR
ncbi:MAG TPA: sigma-70 family RNA polymerase sigma factor [Rhodanobacteraceae bacterium]|nr:sigma-70 family RNA polymerase sigma factor [Rhodanobacteraceae bacterium]